MKTDSFGARGPLQTSQGPRPSTASTALARRPAWPRASTACRSRSRCCSRRCCATWTASWSRRTTSMRLATLERRPHRPRSSCRSCRPAWCCRTSPACPRVVDLAAMRAAVRALGGDPRRINPLVPVDLVIDHSVQVDHFGSRGRSAAATPSSSSSATASATSSCAGARRPSTTSASCRRPPASSTRSTWSIWPRCVLTRRTRTARTLAFPDTLVGTDSHTTMINGLGVLGWGVGGIEAEAVMLGQPLYMLTPAGDRLPADRRAARGRHRHRPGADRHPDAAQEGRGREVRRVLRPRPRRHEPGRPRHHRQHGARVRRHLGFFPVDDETLRYLRRTGRTRTRCDAGRALLQGAGPVPHRRHRPTPIFTDTLELDLATVEPSLAGPQAPAGPRAAGADARQPSARRSTRTGQGARLRPGRRRPGAQAPWHGRRRAPSCSHGAVVIAAITSCTNTSQPVGDARRRPAGARRRSSAGLKVQALRQDQPGARLARW